MGLSRPAVHKYACHCHDKAAAQIADCNLFVPDSKGIRADSKNHEECQESENQSRHGVGGVTVIQVNDPVLLVEGPHVPRVAMLLFSETHLKELFRRAGTNPFISFEQLRRRLWSGKELTLLNDLLNNQTNSFAFFWR